LLNQAYELIKLVDQKIRNEEFKNLNASTWALIGHEKAATQDIKKAFFSDEAIKLYPNLNDRINIYYEIGKKG
jgi:hypothetical protein